MEEDSSLQNDRFAWLLETEFVFGHEQIHINSPHPCLCVALDTPLEFMLFPNIKHIIISLPLHHPHPAPLNIIQWIDSKMQCKLLTVVMRSSLPPQRQPGHGRPRIASTTYTWLCMVAVIPANSSECQSGTYRSYSLHDMPRTPFNMITVTWGNQPARPVACCKKLWAVSLQLNA